MANLPRLTATDGTPCAPGQVLEVGPGGLALNVTLADARRLKQATLRLAATGAVASELAPAAALDSDGATVGAGGVADFSDAAKAANSRWLGIDWGAERAIVGLTLTAASASASQPASGARVRMFSAGNWLPLPARDTLSFVGGAATARFPACAATRLTIELLAENKVNNAWTGVLVPGAVNLSGLKVGVQVTPQPCHVSIAVADDAPFFSVAGPLPAQPVAVEGLVRALNRYLSDHPGATSIPLTLRAASAAKLLLAGFDALQEPAPTAAGTGAGSKPPPPPPRPEKPGTQPAGNPSGNRGRWVDARHSAAQAFQPPPAGSGLSAVELWVRALSGSGAADGSSQVSGRLALHADAAGRPADTPAAGPVPWRLPLSGTPSEAWLRCELPLPAVVPAAPWWAVLQVDEGDLLWYLGDAAPAGAGAGLWRVDGGAWMPVDPAAAGGDAPSAWLQARVQLLPSDTTATAGT